MILQETYSLNNGMTIPKVGFGTWMIDDEAVVQAVKDALEIGYRHIDTAQAYGNERGVGEAIRTSGVDRSEIFLTSKVAAEHKTYEAAASSIDESLEKLGLETIDLMIIHAPQPWDEFREANYDEGNIAAWQALEDAVKAGKIRAIGLSNFNQHDVENILEHATIKPVINQILAHISNTLFELIDFFKENDILVEAYSPVGHGELMKNEEIKEIAERYGVSVPQLAIRYCLELGLLPLPKSENKEHIKANGELDFNLSNDDLQLLKKMDRIDNYGDSSSFPVYSK
ncbi:aldo/keto reductase [Enterococcus faecalis]|uniref:aldo/keto reductase n=1 Tax=Enterococcus faecalis TaxID=1351 RepID=UPI001144C566|nr:aldo/keto reductase [Enterococcus faecalis]EIA6622751.1 aldo/keto reductase [Enterococcus faecalis]MBP4074894.1 aldo/keto reductase [Enterococcus faecalis]MBP4093002.1 aldo/keto reductase [Enterococcus faecalis]MUN81716.1 aldo/keto reductase [Enterococcus faecalis]NGG28935.1 aldo/keto reductase [Enterococcus faecalis]